MFKNDHYGIPEDTLISNLYRNVLQNAKLKFTDDIDLAASFSCEATFVNNKQYSSECLHQTILSS